MVPAQETSLASLGSTVHRSRLATPRRRLDPLRVPESVGLVQPSWAPYTASSSSAPSPGRRPARQDWSSRHHVCSSKDNARLPRLQRSYFDDAPHTSAQQYHVLPGHGARNFDHFCLAETHLQCSELEQRFKRYPFIERLASEGAAAANAPGGAHLAHIVAGGDAEDERPAAEIQSPTTQVTTREGTSPTARRPAPTAWSTATPRIPVSPRAW